jgi:hypothetical protein
MKPKCTGRSHEGYDLDNIPAAKARELCDGCPVIMACLASAMEEEKGCGPRDRFTIRGGMTPRARAQLAGIGKACGEGHTNRWNKAGTRCLECKAIAERERYERFTPLQTAQKRAQTRAYRGRQKVAA